MKIRRRRRKINSFTDANYGYVFCPKHEVLKHTTICASCYKFDKCKKIIEIYKKYGYYK